MNIRPITEAELDKLSYKLQEVGRFIDHQKRIRAQQERKAVYLVAWEDETPVGHKSCRLAGQTNTVSMASSKT